jgi:hypothetical protein
MVYPNRKGIMKPLAACHAIVGLLEDNANREISLKTASRSNREWTTPLALLAIVLLATACSGHKSAPVNSFDSLRTEIVEQVAEPERAAQMQIATQTMESAMLELVELAKEGQEAIKSLMADYESTRADFEALFADFLEQRRPLTERMLDAQLELKDLATDEEWKSLAKKTQKVISQAAWQTTNPPPND